MSEHIQIDIDREVYEQLRLLMVPPMSDVNAVIQALLCEDGHPSRAATALKADAQHFTFAQELDRASQGVYECGGCT